MSNERTFEPCSIGPAPRGHSQVVRCDLLPRRSLECATAAPLICVDTSHTSQGARCSESQRAAQAGLCRPSWESMAASKCNTQYCTAHCALHSEYLTQHYMYCTMCTVQCLLHLY